ncbi:MAG: 50S ribosomal protein L23 [Cytophagaceae bacterium]|nr:50S ribosomal protein L23 [Gemmatimonadaceae bacterium]
MATLHRTIVRPLVTEKTSAQYQARGEYVFEVARDASKPAIRQAIERLWGVTVTGVWTMNTRGKPRRNMGKTAGLRPSWKKAIVTLQAGDKLPIFEV